jgi:preprotein translocase subunit SecE
MTTDVQTNTKLDAVKWIVVVALVLLAIWGNQHFANASGWARAGGVMATFLVAGFIAFTTIKGRATFDFAKEAHVEVRKVVWPTRQETMQTTLIVAVFVVIMALILWFIDWSIVKLLSFVVG